MTPVIDNFIQQLVNSEFNWKRCREIVTSALTGYVRKERRRKRKGEKTFRSGHESLESRIKKMLVQKYGSGKKGNRVMKTTQKVD